MSSTGYEGPDGGAKRGTERDANYRIVKDYATHCRANANSYCYPQSHR
ncbi:hypothetical protein [Rhizobium leguminosarum]|nr:hypothetical protein [Rhizobium leguminosarum]